MSRKSNEMPWFDAKDRTWRWYNDEGVLIEVTEAQLRKDGPVNPSPFTAEAIAAYRNSKARRQQ